jgi:hypothetical protein
MKIPTLRLLLFPLVAASLCAAPPARATPPSGGSDAPSTPSSSSDDQEDEFQSVGIGRHAHAYLGVVLDLNDLPVSGAYVKLFVDGELSGAAVTEADGTYQLQATYDEALDATVLLWFTAPDRSLVSKEIVLAESKACKQYGIISPCVPRAVVTPGRRFRVYLFDPASRVRELNELGCLP